MTDQHDIAPTAPISALARVIGVEVGGEIYLFERALRAEQFAIATRDQGPRALGTLQVLDEVAAQQLLVRLRARA